ncbi:hypothetical protein GF360_03195 [candidate division WWE3 bacterium]|nr:hypothetical protein [candidate division WWE3 bacterium]
MLRIVLFSILSLFISSVNSLSFGNISKSENILGEKSQLVNSEDNKIESAVREGTFVSIQNSKRDRLSRNPSSLKELLYLDVDRDQESEQIEIHQDCENSKNIQTLRITDSEFEDTFTYNFPDTGHACTHSSYNLFYDSHVEGLLSYKKTRGIVVTSSAFGNGAYKGYIVVAKETDGYEVVFERKPLMGGHYEIVNNVYIQEKFAEFNDRTDRIYKKRVIDLSSGNPEELKL